MGIAPSTVSHRLFLKGSRYMLQSESSLSGSRMKTENLDKMHLLCGMLVLWFLKTEVGLVTKVLTYKTHSIRPKCYYESTSVYKISILKWRFYYTFKRDNYAVLRDAFFFT